MSSAVHTPVFPFSETGLGGQQIRGALCSPLLSTVRKTGYETVTLAAAFLCWGTAQDARMSSRLQLCRRNPTMHLMLYFGRRFLGGLGNTTKQALLLSFWLYLLTFT